MDIMFFAGPLIRNLLNFYIIYGQVSRGLLTGMLDTVLCSSIVSG